MRETVGRLLGAVVSVLLTVFCCLTLYALASLHEVNAFWQYTPGALMLYGEAPEPKYLRAYTTVAARARSLGLSFADPQIVQTNRLLNLWYLRWKESFVIAVSGDGKYLLVDPLWMTQFADDELECVFAHELGHAIDFQGLSEKHPVMVRLQCLDSQERADSIGRLLCGYERYQGIMRRHIKRRPLVVRTCAGTDPVP